MTTLKPTGAPDIDVVLRSFSGIDENAVVQVQAILRRRILRPFVVQSVLITPFHNMLLCSPATSSADVQRMLVAFDEVLAALAQDRLAGAAV